MLMTSKPWLRYQRDSARVEKRGPWITITVPDGWTVMPAAPAASTATADSSAQ
jgi:hypothetical protein